jgi:hypothetical protein
MLHTKDNARMYTTCDKEEGTKDKYSLHFHRASFNNRHKVRLMHLIQVVVRIKLTTT